ncbi:uncharacterized protein N7482_000647 [Penicillium canariense]|uniref:FHA domain-containing protein n=1 Tax=Penicillium canariense TaxID=189055 RepID=A0A9W9LSU6_9EURO|nr:uncharacterized protein N7482_000647 [Penicillium canariense]KAJ5174770.1 hypothetical protein N7482_000647 [Penicillium canariense]
MTAVASPPSVQSGSRLGWYSTGNGGQGALSSVDAGEVSRMFMPRKHVQRSNSSSSLGSTSSTSSTSTTTVTNSAQDTHTGQTPNSEVNTWSSKKKPIRNPWPSSKAEPVAGVTNTRSQAVPAFSSGPTASSTMSAMHQPSNIVPSQHMLQSSQQNGIRQTNGQSAEPPAILALTPVNGTFEKKQINVPFYPEVLRIGRQTNAKTVPTPVNGFFDSKVLSRQHAEIWADKTGKIWIRDVKSSNGTFVNGNRLSPENRESEPHELRENDTLELGIDIVSEDQNTIVHHKVSAKVEHAGLYGTTPNILDLNFGDLDPASGGGLLPSPLSQPLSHLRGRSGSNLSNRSVQSNASHQLNAMHQQRQMNYWNSPISVEQVVKRLTGELKQAKQQSQDLRQTDDFLTAIMKPGYAEKEKAMKPSPLESNGPRQLNGRPKMPRVDSFSRFSEPPAPPPQQPLPEKPDAPPRGGSDAFSPLKRSDTERPKSASTNSPVSRDSSQILALLESLSTTKRELETQGTRIKELEDLLRQEKTARESAEAKLKQLEMHLTSGDADVADANAERALDTSIDLVSQDKQEHYELGAAGQTNGSILPSEATASDAEKAEPSTEAQLQRHLESVMEQMDEMSKQMASFKERAEKTEDDNVGLRKSLAEMIETIRQERAEKASAAVTDNNPRIQTHDSNKAILGHLGSVENGTAEPKMGDSSVQRFDAVSEIQGMDATATANTRWQRRHYLEEASPYASMLGVVLLGVGLMAYLNGWQKVDK